ncbi:MAG: hypothetical protein H6618_05790 [Deltaproteobacteria bacterium]|nr:hypothetical protein [Deltaproteobacteria bacterium]
MISRILSGLFFSCCLTTLNAKSITNSNYSTNIKKNLQTEISIAPSTEDWKLFWSSGKVWRKNLWDYHKQRGHILEDWAWEWQLGWVRSCETTAEGWCQQLLKEALFAKAGLVRSRAAQAWGNIWRGHKDKMAIRLLAQAYQNPENIRQNKPLFIRKRILHAIKGIGGEYALKTAQELAAEHTQTQEYWLRLNHVSGK